MADLLFRFLIGLRSVASQDRARSYSTLFPGSLFSASLCRWNRDLVAAGHVTTQTLGGRKSAGRVGQQGFPLDQIYLSTHPAVLDGSLFQRLREAEKRDPGNEVGSYETE